MSSSTGTDADISGAKIDPLSSNTKDGVPRDEDLGGVAGTDETIDQARIDPIGGKGQYQHVAPHADDQGVVGKDANIDGARIDPLAGNAPEEDKGPATTGLEEEQVDAARIAPLGEVREEMQ